MEMGGKICVVTGASSGIGRETARALAEKGARVIVVGRDPKRSEDALDYVAARSDGASPELLLADLSVQSDVRRLAAEILARCDRIDVLVNNAGGIHGRRRMTEDGVELTLAVNHLAPFLLTNLLLGRVEASVSRVVTVSSGAHASGTIRFDDLHGERRYSAMRAYSQSKLANILFTQELARRLEDTDVTANCLHPGVVGTRFGKRSGTPLVGIAFSVARPLFLSPKKGAETVVYLASSPEVERISGLYFHRCAPAPSSQESRNSEVASRLWKVSKELTGLPTTEDT